MKHDYKGITSLEIRTIQLRLRTPQKKLCSPVQNAPHSHSPWAQLKDLYSAVKVPELVPVLTTTRTAACRVQSLLSIIFIRYIYFKGTTILNVGIILVYWDDMFRLACDHLQVFESSYIQYATYVCQNTVLGKTIQH